MLIAKVETIPLRIPFTPGQTSAASVWGPAHLAAVDALLVKVTTDQGYEGWGEAFGLQATAVTKRAIDDLITPLCLGQDPSRIAALMLSRSLAKAYWRNGAGGYLFRDWRCWKRSTRPWVSTIRCWPLKKGWQTEQTSVLSSFCVEPVTKVLPHRQCTTAS